MVSNNEEGNVRLEEKSKSKIRADVALGELAQAGIIPSIGHRFVHYGPVKNTGTEVITATREVTYEVSENSEVIIIRLEMTVDGTRGPEWKAVGAYVCDRAGTRTYERDLKGATPIQRWRLIQCKSREDIRIGGLYLKEAADLWRYYSIPMRLAFIARLSSPPRDADVIDRVCVLPLEGFLDLYGETRLIEMMKLLAEGCAR